MSDNWYFTRDSKQRLGPFTFEQLRQLAAEGLLNPSHMVLEDGSQKWSLAGSIHGVFSPPSQVSGVRQVVSVDAEEQPAQAAEESDPSRRTRERMFWLALAIVGFLVLLPVPIALLASLDQQTLSAISNSIGNLLFFIAVVGGIAGLFLIYTGIRTGCPDCKKWWAGVLIGRQVIEKKKCYGLVTRRAYTSTSGSVSGTGHHWGQADHQTYSGSTHSSGSTSWKERVPVIRTTYLLTYECKFCHARWNKTKVEEVEDFDIER